MNENYPLKHLPPLKGEVAATAVGGVLQKSDESFDKATADFVNPSVCVPQTSPLSGATRGGGGQSVHNLNSQINHNLFPSVFPKQNILFAVQ